MLRSLIAGFGLTCLTFTASEAVSLYTITDLGTLGGTSAATAISNTGVVVGYSYPGSAFQPFIWSQSEGMRQIVTGGPAGARALGVNSAGTVVGDYYDELGNQRAFSWTEGGGLIDLTPASASGAFAYGINESGQIVGQAVIDGVGTAFYWNSGVSQPVVTPGYRTYAYDINETGQIVGGACPVASCTLQTVAPAFWASSSNFQLLPAGGSAYGINEAGTVVGATSGPDGAWKWSATGGYQALATLGGDNAGASDVNAAGYAVGYAFPQNSGSAHAVVWSPDGQVSDLNAFVTDLTGWQFLNAATALNDAGQIAGYGHRADGATHAFLLNPVPIPPAAAVDDGPVTVTAGVERGIPVGANDVGFTSPVTVTVTTAPTKGTITAISPLGPAAGMTITYVADIGAFGADSFVYEMTDSTPFTDSATVTVNISPDTDSDGVADPNDNCTLISNTNQLDTNGDGYGNICDADLNDSGTVTTADFGLLRSVLGRPASFSSLAAAADVNGSGTVTTADFGLLRARLGTAPGPSGLHP